MKSMHVLLRNAVDYAGLFPPAGLDMGTAVNNFATYLAGEDSWALGRFIVPVSRLDEFARAAAPLLSSISTERTWNLAALSAADLGADLAVIENFNSRYAASGPIPVMIDTVERRAGSVDDVRETMHRIPAHLQAYLELPVDRDPAPLLQCLAGSTVRGKVRTGGVTADAFPSPADLLRFIEAAVQAKVPFKATAGLHHPLRSDYRLTYAPDSARGRMFGFLNVFLTAAWLHSGRDRREALELLEEGSPAAIQIDDGGIGWRDFRLGLPEIGRARREAIIAFGSCSFTEPIGELQTLNFLEPRVSQA
ncbi:MAG TPA: hypothetical protein VFZ87_05590 [Gemmatimonadales bacterium]